MDLQSKCLTVQVSTFKIKHRGIHNIKVKPIPQNTHMFFQC